MFSRERPGGALFLVAALATFLNAFKPLHIDDAAYYAYARQFASSPLDPYGFAVFWYQHPEPANAVLAPPVLPLWWSLALRVTDEPVLWKLWLFPFCLCLAWALHALARRFAGRLALPLTALTVLSPAFLPSLNLMLDVPAQALSLAALALFLSAADRSSLPRAALAGLVAGVAMQTKYTGFLAPAAMFLYALAHHRLRLWLPAVAVALAVFAAWEGFLVWRYGQSHFLYHLSEGNDSLLERGYMVPLLLSLPGTVAPAVLVLGGAALRPRTVPVLATAVITLLGYVVLACVDLRFRGEVGPSRPLFGASATATWEFTLAEVLFGVYGLALWTVVVAATWRLCRLNRLFLSCKRPKRSQRIARPDDWFLALWLGLEVAGFFALSPFPAVRRVLGLIVVMVLLTGRLAARTCRARPGLVGIAVAHGVLLGLVFQAVDFRGAAVQREAVRRAGAWIGAEGSTRQTIWFVGHWGFQFYAERTGLRPVVPAYDHSGSASLPAPSRLARGDWLVVPDDNLVQQEIDMNDPRLRLTHRFFVDDGCPLQTVPFFYGGHVGLEHRRGPHLEVRIYRVQTDLVPAAAR
ncbi:MAG: glycosyltransferase family 39 protein [Planctomycetes bacterium]|nr:glycosyltransferase family 39 protein [Planctomycetota bacterium]